MLRLIKNSTFKGIIIFLLGPPLGGMFGCAGGFAYLMSPAHAAPTHPFWYHPAAFVIACLGILFFAGTEICRKNGPKTFRCWIFHKKDWVKGYKKTGYWDYGEPMEPYEKPVWRSVTFHRFTSCNRCGS